MTQIYHIPTAASRPDWATVPKAPIATKLWNLPADITAYAQLACGTDRLFVHLHADEAAQRAENHGLLDQPCEDSCLEFFFRPVADDPRYLNIEMNPNCCLYLGLGTGRDDLTRLMLPNNARQLCATVDRTTDRWDLYYEIPFALIRLFFPSFQPEGTMYGNFYHCGDLTVQEHYLAWNPVGCAEPDFHRPDYFAPLVFEK